MNANTSRSGGAVKPGDLAIVCRRASWNYGRIVQVVERAPDGVFLFPDGVTHERNCFPGRLRWVCKAVGGPFWCNYTDGHRDLSSWTVFAATSLRPLPCDDVPEVERHTDEVTA